MQFVYVSVDFILVFVLKYVKYEKYGSKLIFKF